MLPTHLAEAEAPLCLSPALLAAAHDGPTGHLTSLLASTLQDYTTLLVLRLWKRCCSSTWLTVCGVVWGLPPETGGVS